jgi:hypothetical protein
MHYHRRRRRDGPLVATRRDFTPDAGEGDGCAYTEYQSKSAFAIPHRPPGAITREGFPMLSSQLTTAVAAVLLAATLLTVALVITGAQSELTPAQRVDEAFRALQERPQ